MNITLMVMVMKNMKYMDDFSRALVANKAGVLDLSPLGIGDEISGPVDPVDPPDPIDGEGYFANQVQATGDVDTANLVFSTILKNQDGSLADNFAVKSYGDENDQSNKYILEVVVDNNSREVLQGIDFTLNFNNTLFKSIENSEVSISDRFDLANSVAIKGEGGAVRVQAGSASNLTNSGYGIDSAESVTVASFLLDVDDTAFIESGLDLATAGIQITANLDQTVFSDLSTLRDKGGASAFAIGSEDIDVVMAEVNIEDDTYVFKQSGQSQKTVLSLNRTHYWC